MSFRYIYRPFFNSRRVSLYNFVTMLKHPMGPSGVLLHKDVISVYFIHIIIASTCMSLNFRLFSTRDSIENQAMIQLIYEFNGLR